MASFDEAIPPGQAGKVRATLKTEGYRGAVEKGITLTTNDPERDKAALTVRANIVGSVSLFPGHTIVLPDRLTQLPETRLLVRKDETETGEMKLTDVTVSAPWIGATARKVEKTEPSTPGVPEAIAGDWVIDLKLIGKPSQRNGRELLRFRTGLSREKEVSVPITVYVPPALQVYPTRIVLPEPQGGQGVSGTMTVVVRADLADEPVQVKAMPEQFHVRLEPAGAKVYRAVVSLDASRDNLPRQGSVVFALGDDSVTTPVSVGARAPDAGGPKPSAAR